MQKVWIRNSLEILLLLGKGDNSMKPAKSCIIFSVQIVLIIQSELSMKQKLRLRKGNYHMERFLKRLFCKHDYTWSYLHMINGGIAKLYQCECKKCGKVRYKTH